jgi:hypothetical protein
MEIAKFKLQFCIALLMTGVLPVINGLASENSTTSKSVESTPRAEILKISDRIDELVTAQLGSKGEELNALSSDEVFLRRAYLDIVGRIPTIEETKRFLRSSSKTKRADLIDQLLDSYGYVSRQYNFWADLLRVQSRLPGQLTGVSYIDFLKDSLEENKPYDQFVRELVTSRGPNLERGNGAVGYYLRDRNMPEDNMSNTVRIFLGTRLECAQCHDHPFDKWTQRQYFEMVAFTGGMRYRTPPSGSTYQQIRDLIRKKEIPEKQKPILNRLSQTLTYGIEGSGTGLAKLPEGFLGDDGYEGEVIVGKTMFEGKPLVDAKIPPTPKKSVQTRKNKNAQQLIPGARPVNSREAYGKWLTETDNPRFAKVIANRLWRQTMGLGLIEPVDIIEDKTVASNPELMEFLTRTIVDLDFDMKQFLRAIYNSKTYQAEAYNKDVTEPQTFNFNGPLVRRMSAEQIWDSLLVLTVPDTDERFDQSNNSRYSIFSGDAYENYERLKSMNAEEIKDLVAELAERPNRNKKNSFRDDPEYKKLQEERAALAKQLKAAQKKNNVDLVRKLKIEQAQLVAEYRKRNQAGSFLRASEMISPAPAGHFLREFGQSDREQIDNSNTEPAVTQVLSMMNGYVEERIARDSSSMLMQTALKAKTAKECTESIFLSMLNRKPTSQEARDWESDFREASKQNDNAKIKEIYSDLIWTLANSNEFIFVK